MLNVAKEMGADALVTGHYARRIGGTKNAKLFKALDKEKDQSYFLFSTTKLRFWLGNKVPRIVREYFPRNGGT